MRIKVINKANLIDLADYKESLWKMVSSLDTLIHCTLSDKKGISEFKLLDINTRMRCLSSCISKGNVLYIAFLGDDPVGFAVVNPKHEPVIIESIFVRLELRGEFIGSSMMRCIMRDYGQLPITLKTDALLSKNIEFFNRFGFSSRSVTMGINFNTKRV